MDRRESELHEEDDARNRRKALRLLHATPTSYNAAQHYVTGMCYSPLLDFYSLAFVYQSDFLPRSRAQHDGIVNRRGTSDGSRADFPLTPLPVAERAGLCHQRLQFAGHGESETLPTPALSTHRRRTPSPRRDIFPRWNSSVSLCIPTVEANVFLLISCS